MTDPLSCLFHIMDDGDYRISRGLSRKKRWVIYHIKTDCYSIEMGLLSTITSLKIGRQKKGDRACPVLHLFAAIRQERRRSRGIYERAVLVTENRRTAISISQEPQYMTFLIRETPL